ncbi:hypothetical protein [Eilatimonas milleporae]|uniref:Uncharacterized protein n=1 Tax=Eilatimonas milleporae TaxID=911205 RepID=A0A3M0C1Y8_9PROT|nr:hypothetical protein [Eilatimonas milleporae]RMB02895.1 hypothetical protein BXY39_3248 [Eilatimonas milleporae]
MPVNLVILTLVTAGAPLIAGMLSRTPVLRRGLDGFVLVTVLALGVLSLLPDAMAHLGLPALLLAALGFGLPWLAERLLHHGETATHRLLLVLSVCAFALHVAGDGAALAHFGARIGDDGNFAAGMIILHRMGVATALWWLLRPMLGVAGSLAMILLLAVVTPAGYMLGSALDGVVHAPVSAGLLAFAAGSLLHVMLHPVEMPAQHTPPAGGTETTGNAGNAEADTGNRRRRAYAMAHRIGTCAGLVFVALVWGGVLTGDGTADPGMADHGMADHGIVGHAPADPALAEKALTDPEKANQEQVGQEQAGREQTGREQTGHTLTGHDLTGHGAAMDLTVVRLLSPLLLTLLAVRGAAPWTVLAAVTAGLTGPLSPAATWIAAWTSAWPPAAGILLLCNATLALWAVAVAGLMIRDGARRFFEPFVPAHRGHSHGTHANMSAPGTSA